MKNILLIGAGTMGRVHADAYALMDPVHVAGVVDLDSGKAGKLAEKLGCGVYATYEEALEKAGQIDVVDICLPTDLHAEYVAKAAGDGKHVICEKPLSRDLRTAQEMIDICKAHNVRLFVGHVVRFFPEYAQTKKQLDEGIIGVPAVARLSRCGPFPQGWNNWFADYDRSGGVVLDLMIHDFDFLRWCFGEVEGVYARGQVAVNESRPEDRPEYALVTLRFKNGVIAHVEGSWTHEVFHTKFEFAGTGGVLDYNALTEKSVVLQQRSKQAGMSGVAVPDSPLAKSPYYVEIDHFLTCLETGAEPLVTAEDAVEAVKIALAAMESIRSGKRIVLSQAETEQGGKL